jgi:hypothetical protein
LHLKLSFHELSPERSSPLLPRGMRLRALANEDVQEEMGMVMIVIHKVEIPFLLHRTTKGRITPLQMVERIPPLY